MRSILLIFLSIFLFTSPVLAGDPMVAKAVGRIAKVEAAEASLQAGDKGAGAKLTSDLDWAQKRLNAVVQNGTAEWKSASARLTAVRAKVVAKMNQPAPKPTPQPAPGADPKPKPKPGPEPAPSPAYDHAKLVALNKDIGNAWNNLKIVPMRLLEDASRVGGIRREIEGFRRRLAAFPSKDSNVQIVTSNLDDFEGLLNAGLAQLKGDQGQVASIQKRIAGLTAKYDRKALPPEIKAPFTKGNVEAWAHQMRQIREKELPADIAWLQSVQRSPALEQNLANGTRIYLQSNVTRYLDEIEKVVRERIAGPVEEQLRNCDWILETNPKDQDHVVGRLLGRDAFDKNLMRMRLALEAIDLAESYDKAMGAACVPGPSLSGTEAEDRAIPDRAGQRKKIKSAMAHLKACAVAALGFVRMPAVASTDVELTKIAKRVLGLPKNNVTKWDRMVISRDKKHHERRRGWIEPGSLNTLDLTIYTYAWDDFTVTTAERRGDEIWLFSNKFENYASGDSTTTTGEWYLARRTELTRILPANLSKPPLPEPKK